MHVPRAISLRSIGSPGVRSNIWRRCSQLPQGNHEDLGLTPCTRRSETLLEEYDSAKREETRLGKIRPWERHHMVSNRNVRTLCVRSLYAISLERRPARNNAHGSPKHKMGQCSAVILSVGAVLSRSCGISKRRRKHVVFMLAFFITANRVPGAQASSPRA